MKGQQAPRQVYMKRVMHGTLARWEPITLDELATFRGIVVRYTWDAEFFTSNKPQMFVKRK